MLLLFAAAASIGADDDFRVLPDNVDGIAPPALLEHHLKQKAFAALDRRSVEYEKLKTPEQLSAYQERLRKLFLERLGPFPERTPLNARVVGRLERDGYSLEKVIYESRPGFLVTAALYLPDAPAPYPGILLPCGHSENGKAAEAYQRASIMLAKHGMAVLCFDPIGQGERKQVLDGQGKGRFRPTSEHEVCSPAAILLGRSVATTMVWDGMRGIDYLVSRPDIDPKRIGCAGNSGGGTQTSYLMALDDRIAAAAPNCYITSFRRLLETIGPQDAEQNIFGQVEDGLDHADYVMLRAPRPTLIAAATRDFFDIAGTWDTFRQAKRFYTRMGHSERVELVESDDEHGFTRNLRVATTRWMRRWLLGKDDAVTEMEWPILTDAELQCTPRGQVLLEKGARSVFDFYRDEATRLAEERKSKRRDSGALVERIRRMVSSLSAGGPGSGDLGSAGRVQELPGRAGGAFKVALRPEGGPPIPVLSFGGEGKKGTCLYLHEAGKEAEARRGGAIDALVRDGFQVVAVDLAGIGELQARRPDGSRAGLSYKDVSLAHLLGGSILGIRTDQIIWLARNWGSRPDGPQKPERFHLVAVGELGPPALHAAVLEPDRFASVRLIRSLRSWGDVVRTDVPVNQRSNAVHGALRTYDLPDLVGILGKKVTVEVPVDGAGGIIK